VAWRQYQGLIAFVRNWLTATMAMLKKQLADARKAIKSLEDRMAAMRGRRGGGGARPATRRTGQSRRPGGRGRGAADGSGSLGNGREPGVPAASRDPDEGRASARPTPPLFKSLNLSPDQLAQFQSLLADKQQALMDTSPGGPPRGSTRGRTPTGSRRS
jgi:hypothetical protein